MTLALTVLILYTGLIEGYLRDMERNIVDLELGDVQVHAGDYLDKPSVYTRVESPDTLLTELDRKGLSFAVDTFNALKNKFGKKAKLFVQLNRSFVFLVHFHLYLSSHSADPFQGYFCKFRSKSQILPIGMDTKMMQIDTPSIPGHP